MRKIIYLFVFATALLIVKAFFLDDYIAQYKIDDTNASIDVVESNTSNTNPIVEEKNISNAGDANANFLKYMTMSSSSRILTDTLWGV